MRSREYHDFPCALLIAIYAAAAANYHYYARGSAVDFSAPTSCSSRSRDVRSLAGIDLSPRPPAPRSPNRLAFIRCLPRHRATTAARASFTLGLFYFPADIYTRAMIYHCRLSRYRHAAAPCHKFNTIIATIRCHVLRVLSSPMTFIT